MPYGQSPWQDAAAGTQGMGTSMARIAMAQQIGRMRAQQFAAQLALRQQQEAINQQRVGIDEQRLQAQTPEYQARAYQATSAGDKNYQAIDRQDKMDELARAVAASKFKQMIPGGVPAVLSGQITGEPGPTQAGADVLNQGDLVRNVMQLIGMHNPNELGTMMMGKNIPQGNVNVNDVTGEQTEGLPPRAPTGAPIDPETGMTPYQVQALLLQKSRLADEAKRTDMIMEKLKSSPEYMMSHPDEADSGGTGGKKKPTRAQAAEYVKKFGSPDAAKKQLQNDGFDTSGYAD